jgi:hypothetical protein
MKIENISKQPLVFVCHYFPPDTSVGIRRVLYWSNYFAEAGYKVTVITTPKANSELAYLDVHSSIRIYEFGYFGLRLVKNKPIVRVDSDACHSAERGYLEWARKIKQKVFNRFIGQLADNRLIYVLPFALHLWCFSSSAKYKFLREIDSGFGQPVIISTAPPWPVHLVANLLSKKFKLPHIVDYRDPFFGNHVFSQNLTCFERYIDYYLCNHAYAVTTVSESWVAHYRTLSKNVFLIRNGFDHTKMENYKGKSVGYERSNSNLISLGYFGSIEVDCRIPKRLIEYVVSNSDIFEMHFYGRCDLAQEYAKSLDCSCENMIFHGTLEYSKALLAMSQMDVNVVCESGGEGASHRGLIPTKIYEYVRVYRPVLAIMNSTHDTIDILDNSGLLLKCVPPDCFDFEFLKDVPKMDPSPNYVYIDSLSRDSGAQILEALILKAGDA